jgi:transcriptional regulator with XRE-family HTH domain
MTQGDLEQRTGLRQGNISRVENGHFVPNLKNLQRFAKALDVPLPELFYSGKQRAARPRLKALKTLEKLAQEGGKAGREARFLLKLRTLLVRIPETNRRLFLSLVKQLAKR